MKKKVLSIMAVVLFMGSSLNANTVMIEKQPCQLYAEWVGSLFEELGLSYYSGYFAAYADCIGTLYSLD